MPASADTLIFAEHEQGPDEDLRLQFEAVSRLSDDEKGIVSTFIESILFKQEVKRWAV